MGVPPVSQFWEWLKTESGQTLIAGGAGAVTSIATRWPGFWPATRQLTSGTLTAYYLGDYAEPFFGWLAGTLDLPLDRAYAPGAFIIGATGSFLIETILYAVELKRSELRRKGASHDVVSVERGDRRD